MSLLKIYIKEFLRWIYWGPIRLIVGYIPRGITYRLMELVGKVGAWLAKGKKNSIAEWIETTTGMKRDEAEKTALMTFSNYYKNLLDSLLYNKLSAQNIDIFTKYEGLEHLNEALREGGGAIVLYPHLGNEEYLMPALGHKGYRVNQVASRWELEDLPGMKYWFVNRIRDFAFKMRIGVREKLPVEFIYIDRSMRDSFRKLKNNEILLLAIDGREGKKWLEVEYLGQKAMISPGPMKLAMATGAPVLPCVTFRSGLYEHTLRILPRLDLEHTDNKDTDIYHNTRLALQTLENHMFEHLDQYAKFKLHDVRLFKEAE